MKQALLRERAVYREVGEEEQARYRVKQGDSLLLRVEAYPLYLEETERDGQTEGQTEGDGQGEGVLKMRSRGERIRRLSHERKRVRVVQGAYHEEVLRQLVGKRWGDQFTVDVAVKSRNRGENNGDEETAAAGG